VVNHERESALVRTSVVTALGGDAMRGEAAPVMASDDMSLFLQARPGCYFRVGIAPVSGPPRPHHAPEFEMNEDGLTVGLRVATRVMLDALGG
jgi:metal-dependent amidase/aminoacylase/carboxypeptidase family protein